MKKKPIILSLAISMLLLFAACSEKRKPDNNAPAYTYNIGMPSAFLKVQRQIDSGSHGVHTYGDYSIIDRQTNGGIDCFDADPLITGHGFAGDHAIGYQSRLQYKVGNGTFNDLYGGATLMDVDSGTVLRSYGWNVWDLPVIGNGIVDTQYGYHVRPLIFGKYRNYAFYSEGPTPSFFGGSIMVGGKHGTTAQANTHIFYPGTTTIQMQDSTGLGACIRLTSWAGGSTASDFTIGADQHSLYTYADKAQTIEWFNGATRRMTLATDGAILLGASKTSNGSATLQVQSGSAYFGGLTASSNLYLNRAKVLTNVPPPGVHVIVASGRATLSGGGVTVLNSHVSASCTIQCTVNTPSGIPGIISVPSAKRYAGKSFKINSSSASDNSTVDWQIVENY